MRRLLWIAVIVAVGYFGAERGFFGGHAIGVGAEPSAQVLASAFEDRQSGIQVRGTGTVVRVLSDDNDGSRHQRFILETATGQTLLVAHNIDLAPRVSSLSNGDTVEFNGQYEWNAKGGVIHWTHRDPQGRHAAGWLRHAGRTYQ